MRLAIARTWSSRPESSADPPGPILADLKGSVDGGELCYPSVTFPALESAHRLFEVHLVVNAVAVSIGYLVVVISTVALKGTARRPLEALLQLLPLVLLAEGVGGGFGCEGGGHVVNSTDVAVDGGVAGKGRVGCGGGGAATSGLLSARQGGDPAGAILGDGVAGRCRFVPAGWSRGDG